MIDPHMLHYLIVGATIALPALCVGIGQGIAGKALSEALDTQPASHKELNYLFFLGITMMEFTCLLGVIMGLLLLYRPTPTDAMAITQAGAALALVLPACLIGIAAAYPLSNIFYAFARQPLSYQKLLRQLLLTQIMLQTPILFGFIISIFIHQQTTLALELPQAIKLFASGALFAFGIVGPIIGITLFAKAACEAMGFNRNAHDTIFSFTFISQTIIETPILFVLIVALFLCFGPVSSATYAPTAYLLSALCMTMTTLAAGISSGRTAQTACEQIGKNLHAFPLLSGTSLLGQVFIETNTIYGLIIVIVMLFTLP